MTPHREELTHVPEGGLGGRQPAQSAAKEERDQRGPVTLAAEEIRMRNFLFVMSAVVVLGGCATPGKNTAIGAGAGAAVGAGVGAIAGGWEGAAIGAVVGGVAGGAIGNCLDKQ